MNIKAIQKVSELKCVEQIFVPPSPGDESLGMGAAYHCAAEFGDIAPLPLANAYLGTDIGSCEVEALLSRLEDQNAQYQITKNVTPAVVAAQLA